MDYVFIQLDSNVTDNILANSAGDVGMNVLEDGLEYQQSEQRDGEVYHHLVVTLCNVVIQNSLRQVDPER
jgi:hypothetical protein